MWLVEWLEWPKKHNESKISPIMDNAAAHRISARWSGFEVIFLHIILPISEIVINSIVQMHFSISLFDCVVGGTKRGNVRKDVCGVWHFESVHIIRNVWAELYLDSMMEAFRAFTLNS